MDTGPNPTPNGEPGADVRCPSGVTQLSVALVQAVNALILLLPVLATKRIFPSGVRVTAEGVVPTGYAEPAKKVNAPELAIEKPRTVFVN